MRREVVMSAACMITVWGVMGCATAPSQRTASARIPAPQEVTLYDDLSDVAGVIPAPHIAVVTVTTNVDAIPVTLATMPIDGVKVYRDDNRYMWQAGDLKLEDYSDLKDTIALVCTYAYTTNDSKVAPYISGATYVPRWPSQMRMGKLCPLAFAVSGFENVKPVSGLGIYAVSSHGSLEGFVGARGNGQITYVWFIPNIEAQYDIVFPKHFSDDRDKTVHTVSIRVGQ